MEKIMNEYLLELIRQPTETTYPLSECPVDAVNRVIKLDPSLKGWSFNQDVSLRPSETRYLKASGHPVAMFNGHQRELPGGRDERALFISQNKWEELPQPLKKIFSDPKYRVEVYF